MGGGPGAEDAPYMRRLHELAYFVRNGVLYAGVARTHDGAAFQHVPEGDVMPLEHGLLLRDGLGEAFAEDCREHLPEAVLRMPVIEPDFARLGRRDGTEQQHTGTAVVNRREFVRHPHAGIFPGAL